MSAFNDRFYRKIGRRYFPVSEWPFEPCNGVWIVCDTGTGKSQRAFMFLGDAPDVMLAASYQKHHDLVAATISACRAKGMAPSDIASAIALAIAGAESKPKASKKP